MHEVITLQFGEAANYVGTHYWNFQNEAVKRHKDAGHSESIAQDVLFCGPHDRQAGAGECIPRLLIYDRADGFGRAAVDETQGPAAVPDSVEHTDMWTGPTAVHRQAGYPKSEFLSSVSAAIATRQGARAASLEGLIRFWSDFNEGGRYHKRTLHEVSAVAYGNSLGQMNTFFEGAGVFSGEDSRDDVIDDGGVRAFVEECDALQGFQVLADAAGGFSGYSAAYVERLRDEYPKTPVVLYSVGDSGVGQMSAAKRMDLAVSTASVVENVSAAVPLFAPPEAGPGLCVGLGLAEGSSSSSSLYRSSGFMALNVNMWSYGLLTRQQVMGDVVGRVTSQGYYRLAESQIAPGLGARASKGHGGLLEELGRSFVSCTGSKIADFRGLAGLFVADFGTDVSGLACDRGEPLHSRSSHPMALPKSFPKILSDSTESISVGGVLCTTAASVGYLEMLNESLKMRAGSHLKDYERETVLEYRETLSSTIDKYLSI